MSNEPGAAVLAIFDNLMNRVKQAHPLRSDGKPLGGGVVYSMMVLGMPVAPEDYLNPWSPIAGSSAQDPPGQAPKVAPPTAAPDPRRDRALGAAYKTALLCNTMLQVTTDGTYLEYPTGRHLDAAYESVLQGMQPLPPPPISPDIQAAISSAQKVLYEFDPSDGSIVGKSKLYKSYEKNAAAFALAKANYAIAMAEAKSDPAKADIWPMTSVTYQRAVDDAYDTLKTEGAERVEPALDTIGSVGMSIQDHMIKRARQTFEAFNLGLAGVPSPVPYSFIEPSGWCDPDNDDEGWQSLSVSRKDSERHENAHASQGSQFSWMNTSSSSSESGGGGFLFIAGEGGSSQVSSADAHQGSSQSQSTMRFANSATELSISLEYALCTINRPWLISDVFYMRNWYLVGAYKNSVSDGTERNQANIKDLSKLPLLPMIPQQMLVIRNVVISTKKWGSDGEILKSFYANDESSADSSSNSVQAGGGVVFGPICAGGSASHSRSDAKGQGSQWEARGRSAHFGTTFDGETLKIPGAQIIAFLSDIVPACAPLDDPGLPKKADATTVSASTLQPAAV